jgi:hypothetical protein
LKGYLHGPAPPSYASGEIAQAAALPEMWLRDQQSAKALQEVPRGDTADAVTPLT